ncbi:hypothetical protein N7491_004730 [Penicillium cf. griseofulvum]|nr:hypothetical protein N7491_004730 [Penicillium cf. griseofulvum]
MKFWKLGWGQKEPAHFTPSASEHFPIEAAEAFEPLDEIVRNVHRTGSPPGTLLCSFPDPASGTSLNQFCFQLYRENGVLPGLVGYLEKEKKKLDRDVLEALWKWMLDVPPEAIVQGTFIIMLGYESWFPEE